MLELVGDMNTLRKSDFFMYYVPKDTLSGSRYKSRGQADIRRNDWLEIGEKHTLPVDP
jgi:hypothetical protein